jgi:hypothetical protein
MFLLTGIYVSYADTTPAEIQQTKNNIEQKNKELKNRIYVNDDASKMTYDTDKSTIHVPIGNGTYECGTGSDGKYYCTLTEYNLPVIQPGMELVKAEAEASVPQPKQYKNVFKIIATVMYMFATVYFLIIIAMDFFRKRYMQALALLMMYLVGSAILYVAYKMVFNTP